MKPGGMNVQAKKIGLLGQDKELKEQLEALVATTEWRFSWERTLQVGAESCDVLLVGDDFWTSSLVEQLVEWRKRFPQIQIVLLSPLSRRQEMQRLLRSYADDYLILPLDKDEVTTVLQKCEERIKKSLNADNAQGKTVVCFSPLGRSGKTSLAINLAVALGEQDGRGTVLLDLAAPFGDVVSATGVVGECVETLASATADSTNVIWREYLARFREYPVWIAPASTLISERDKLGYDKMAMFIKSLKQQFAYVVIDTAPEFRDTIIAALDSADTILLLAVLEQVPSVKNIKVCLEIFRSRGYDDQKVRLILNRATAKYNLQVQDVEKNLKHPIVRRLPNEFTIVRQSLANKSPFIKSDPHSNLAKEVVNLAEAVKTGVWEQEQRADWKRFTKWFS